MWPNERPRMDKTGKRWNFHYWNQKAQRLFFWDEERTECGVVLFAPGSTRTYRQIENLIDKLVSDQSLRKQHLRELRFPLDRYYSEYGAFPEEFELEHS